MNNPLIFIDIGGRTVGNPDDKTTKDVKTALMKTESGKELWKQIEQSEKVIYFHSGGNSNRNNVYSHLKNKNAGGETVSKSMYEKIQSDGTYGVEESSKAYKFNKETGEYDKTSDWDETHILIDETALKVNALRYQQKFSMEGKDLQWAEALDLSTIEVGGEEAAHSIQTSVDFKPKIKDKKTGEYKDNEKGELLEYLKRAHEIDAKRTTHEILMEYIELFKK